MNIKMKFIFMSIIVLGLIVNTASFLDVAFAEKPDKEAAKAQRDEAKAQREDNKKDIQEFNDSVVITLGGTSSTTSTTEKVPICHIPPGNPGNAHTITIGSPAIRAHLAHGDDIDDPSCDSVDIKEFRDGTVVTSSSTTTICHIPPGNPGNAHTITIGNPAARAHFANHNDTGGPCGPGDYEGLEDYKAKKESRLAEGSSQKELKALERAEKLIEKLEQQINNLEKRLQQLLEKYESGEYYGNISTADAVTNSYVISFEGIALSIYDESVTTEMSGELFMENQVTTSNTSKFKILYGEVIVGNDIYDVVFGKARLSPSGPSGEEDSLVILLQTIDSEENDNTIKITLGFNAPLEGEFGSPPEEFEILDNSKVSGQWILEGSGQLSLKP